jgi:hypothetical protein
MKIYVQKQPNSLSLPLPISIYIFIYIYDHCILYIDISDNPLGYQTERTGSAVTAGIDSRLGLAKNKSLTRLDISRVGLLPMQLVPIFSGLGKNQHLMEIHVGGIPLDEPSCLQLANALDANPAVNTLDIPGAKIGPKG